MQTNLAHEIRLDPTVKQETFFKKACGVARVAYNYGLTEYLRILNNTEEKPDIYKIKKEFNKIKGEKFPWMCETHRDANSQPFANLMTAFSRFFKKLSKFPKYKKKGKKDSFYIANDRFKIDKETKRIYITKIGWIKTTEFLRFEGKINSASVKRRGNYWFVVISVSTEKTFKACNNQEAVGVDLGIKTLATFSNNIVKESKYPLRNKLKKLKRLQRELSRKVKGSSNRYKQQMKVAKLHYVISCIRKDTLNKITTELCENYKIICLEDLNTKGMLKSHKLAKAISDMGWGMFVTQLKYKSQLHGNEIVFVNRFFPSSKKCSCCGNIKEDLTLEDRVYKCNHCGLEIDRDLNAAINIKTEGLRILQENKKSLGLAKPEITSMELEALDTRAGIETTNKEVEILPCI